ncbi:MAG: DUF72 domain-containing protein [Candidatus Aminicenantes bacterium]|nr:DUF72 domain-containing protein [Candidatus Aminicenantes bacterium]
MAQYHTGTAGWSYRDWEGMVYPRKKPPGFHALQFLSNYIDFMEINSTFYRMPVFNFAQSWTQKVKKNPHFLFAVKLHQDFTHKERNPTQNQADEFKFGIEPLRANGRLGAILIQFPWSFSHSSQNKDYLDILFTLFSGLPLALEVRHSSWDQPDFLKFLRDHRVAFCNIDQPIFRSSIKPTAYATNPGFSYVRLHGRNYKNWFRKNAGRDQRYDYLYSDEELQDWIHRIQELGDKSKKTFVVTNNHYRGQALTNAIQIKYKLTNEKMDVPEQLLQNFPELKKIIKEISKGQIDLFEKG